MTRWDKIITVASFEFLSTVKRAGYLVTTFGMPLFIAAYGAVIAVPNYYADKRERATTAVFGVVDDARVLSLAGDVRAQNEDLPEEVRTAIAATGQGAAIARALPGSNLVFRPFPDEPTARAALARRDLQGYFVLPADYLQTGLVDVYRPDTISMSGSESRTAFSGLIREHLVQGRVDKTLAARLVTPLADTRRFAITRTGELKDGGQVASAVRFAVPLIFIVLFLMSVLMTSGYLMQGTATEKENKVVEVLLASANPDEILAGKLIGLGGAGLLQIGVWMLIVLVLGLGAVPLLISARIDMPWAALALAVPLFLIAFLFFGSLMLGTGSLGSNMREAQQLAMVWSLTAALPLILLGVLMKEPHGTVARILTWLPFSAGPLIVMRASLDPGSLAWWEVAGSFLVLILGTVVAIRFGARLFRIGLLSSGARPSLREIVRQARLAA